MKMDSKYRAIGLDMDGTLLDTHVDYVEMANLVFDQMVRMGVPENVIKRKDGFKFNLESGTKYLIEQKRGDEIPMIHEKITKAARDIEMQNLEEARPFPGTVETLKRFREKKYGIGVLTRGCREYADAALEFCGVSHLIDAVIARDDYSEKEAKPSPIAMLHLAEKLDVKPEEILYVGDHAFDYRCAHDSGAGFIGVLSGVFDIDDWHRIDKNITVIDSVHDLYFID
ncbi:MAG: HAD family hydrolase [Candidatus Methanomethylophilaceae archaeon]